jgi:hypothetical protein
MKWMGGMERIRLCPGVLELNRKEKKGTKFGARVEGIESNSCSDGIFELP